MLFKTMMSVNSCGSRPSNASGRVVALSSERVRQRSVFLLSAVASRVEAVQSVLCHLVVARPQAKLRRPHTWNISTIAGNWSFRLQSSCFCTQKLTDFVDRYVI